MNQMLSLPELIQALRFHGSEDGPTILEVMEQAADALERLTGWLNQHGQHDSFCGTRHGDDTHLLGYPCDCGWNELEQALEGR